MKKYILRWVVLILGLLVTLSLFFFFKTRKQYRVCQNFKVTYRHGQTPLQTTAEIQTYLEKDTIKFLGTSVSQVDLSKIEHALESNPFIQSSDCYFDMNGTLRMELTQKTPILRVIPNQLTAYYLDENGRRFPLSTLYSPKVKVATGFIPNALNTKLYTFISYVNQSEFWNHFIEQIFVRPNGDIIFTTKVGGFEVVVGGVDRLEQKLDKLKRFLLLASPNQGWEEYREINLKFKDQVICKK